MKSPPTRALLTVAAPILAFVIALPADAGGPILVNGAGEPLTWLADPVPYNPDRGTLGALSNVSATSHLATASAVWMAVPSSTVSMAAAAQLPVDVTVANYPDYLLVCGDSLNPIVFDSDGKITDDLFGEGANEHVIGFAGAACGTYVPPVITEGFAALNGRFLDGIDSPTNPELTADEFDAVLTHEFGHYIGLDHSQVNLQEAFDGNPSNDDAIATMFPILINATEAASLHLDDVVSVSSLYPEASFTLDSGAITGSVFLADGTTPFQGAHVIARENGDPRLTAVAQVSGARFAPDYAGGPPDPALRGHYELVGLPPGSYTVEIESVFPGFTGGSSVGPLDTPASVPGPPEFWNGADEDGTDPPDDPADAELIVVTAGTSVDAIDISINQGPPPANDECADAVEIVAAPYADSRDVTGATRGAFDPLQECSAFPSQNYNSVWYRYTPPADGVVRVTTTGSGYDTLVSVSTGACGALAEADCDDDSGPQVSSDLSVVVEAGVPYILEVTCSQPGGGLLEFALDFTPSAACPPAPRNDCSAPSSAGRSSLKLSRGDDPADYQVGWKWGPGDASAAELGTPLPATGTSYAFCVYDAMGTLAMAARAPAGNLCGTGSNACWRARSTRVSYKDAEHLPDGLHTLSLRSGDGGDARFKAKGLGDALDMPVLPLVFPLVTQLLNSDGPCWQSTFPLDGVQRNDDLQLKARGG